MNFGYYRIACASPDLSVADVDYNVQQIASIVHKADQMHTSVLIFPELSLTGFTCADLFLQQQLEQKAVEALAFLCDTTRDTHTLFCVGLPVEVDSSRFSCAAFVFRGNLLALIPKSFPPNYSEFYERRWFTPADECTRLLTIGGFKDVPLGCNILIESAEDVHLKVASELCEDLWVPLSPSTRHALHGATLIANLSASNEVVSKADYRRLLVSSHSAKTVSVYAYSSSGRGESTTDMVFGGHRLICSNGDVKAESTPFAAQDDLLVADVDFQRITQERLKTTTFAQGMAQLPPCEYRTIKIHGINRPDFSLTGELLLDTVAPLPFVPRDEGERKDRCLSVVQMQSEGLSKRLRAAKCKSAVVGLSGGLDSTLALLVTARAVDIVGLSRKSILAVTMPAFGTTERTLDNACALAEKTGATLRKIDVSNSVLAHFADIAHEKGLHDAVYENAQARERTQVLMDLANATGGIVVGTGDLSELALGWCTYNGDHMSMYAVNSSIPKTLVRHLVSWFADEAAAKGDEGLAAVLRDILDTPVSPELLPPEDGKISQKTEELVGPYELHDFFLYYFLRFGFAPSKIRFLARCAFSPDEYDDQTIDKWLGVFYRRFFAQQFKRSCVPDGAKVGTVSLSPRGDWRMPSDASAALWLSSLDGGKC